MQSEHSSGRDDRHLDSLQAECARRRVALEQSLHHLVGSLTPAQATAALRETGQDAAAQALDLARKNPAALACIGTGAAMLLLNGLGKTGMAAPTPTPAGAAPPAAAPAAAAPAAPPRSGRYLALGAAALGAGALVAALLPRTRQEDAAASALSGALKSILQDVTAPPDAAAPPRTRPLDP